MNHLVRLLAGSAAISICFAGLMSPPRSARAQVTSSGALYQFHVRLRVGTKLSYAMKVNEIPPGAASKSPAKPISISTPIAGTVTAVQNRVATVKISMGPSVVNGQAQGEARDLEIRVDDRGRPIGAPAPGLENLLGNLPDHPIKVGDSYTVKQNVSFAGIPIAVNARYKFLGLAPVNGQTCARFTVGVTGSGHFPTPQGASAPFSIRGTGTMQVAVSDGLISHSGGDINVLISQGAQATKMTVNTTIDRK